MADFAGKGTPEDWRRRAKETRAYADRHADPATKTTLLEIAALYERLAEIAGKGDAS